MSEEKEEIEKVYPENKKFIIDLKEGLIEVLDLGSLQMHDKPVAGFYEACCTGLGSYDMYQLEVQIPKNSLDIATRIIDPTDIVHLFGDKSLRIHRSMGLSAKLGYILYGKHGTGKTTAMYAVSKYLIDNFNAIAIAADGIHSIKYTYNTIKRWRKLDPDQLFIIMVDECEDEMKNYEAEMKKLLDSGTTPERTIFIGTTNYFEKIPDTITDRPSRIKACIDCSTINDGEEITWGILSRMNSTLDKKDQLSDEEIKAITPDANGKTLDEIKHLFLEATIGGKENPKTKKKSEETATADSLE